MSWSSLRDVFWNDRERRLRAPWRVVLGLLLVLVFGVAGSALGSALERAGVGPGPPTGGSGVVAQVAVLAGFVAGLCLAGRYVDRRRLRDFGLGQSRAWWADLGFGLALSVATVLTSGLFGLAHTANPNASALATVTITLYGGFLAAGYLLTGRIATPIGVHVTWNLAVSSVFGFPVSGIRTPVTVVAVEQTGPAVVTGGEFGPEGGLVSLVALAAGFGALLGWVRWREGGVKLRESVSRPALRRGDGRADRETGPPANHDG
ncbi:hypothetical protein BRC64_10710 [Halobacteriales archaeon QH_10_67_22]|nr:MAG: hypothetical protein BRC64_10710 [Halobacteriales archaeon QH_10_67_22]